MSLFRFRRAACAVGVAALLGPLAVSARAATTTYTSVYAGGTISPSDTVLLNDGATVAGNVVDNETLQFNQSAGNTLTISTTISAGTFDLVSGSGSVAFGGILNLTFSGGTYTEGTDVLQLFANTGGLSGSFSAVNFSGLAAGQSATFNPATGFISVVPEPSTCASLLAGLACGGISMFRRRKRTGPLSCQA